MAAWWATRVLYCLTHRYTCIVGAFTEDRVGTRHEYFTHYTNKIPLVNETFNLGFK